MLKDHAQFRSKREREQEVKLEKNYREIGISAIAAASRAIAKRDTKPAVKIAMIPAE